MKNFKKAFTLIELLIVITIIGILAVALLPSVLGAPARARDAARKADIGNIIKALEVYNSDNQKYPAGDANGKGCIGPNSQFTVLNAYFQGGKPPKDPQDTNAKTIGGCAAGEYLYCRLSGAPAGYYVAANVEVKGDGNARNADVANPTCGAAATAPVLQTAQDNDSAYVVIQ